jgi:hypothetical protein
MEDFSKAFLILFAIFQAFSSFGEVPRSCWPKAYFCVLLQLLVQTWALYGHFRGEQMFSQPKRFFLIFSKEPFMTL